MNNSAAAYPMVAGHLESPFALGCPVTLAKEIEGTFDLLRCAEVKRVAAFAARAGR